MPTNPLSSHHLSSQRFHIRLESGAGIARHAHAKMHRRPTCCSGSLSFSSSAASIANAVSLDTGSRSPHVRSTKGGGLAVPFPFKHLAGGSGASRWSDRVVC